MNFSFTSPLFLLGTVAMVIPLLVHLLFKRRYKTVYFSSIFLIKSALQKKMRKLKLTNFLLLLLRMLVIILFCLALANPVQNIRGGFLIGSRLKSTNVIILDASLSMQYQTGKISRFEEGKEIALNLIDRLKEGDKAAFILACSPLKIFFENFTFDLKKVKEVIKESKPTFTGANSFEAFKLATEILAKEESQKKQIFFITDHKKNTWLSFRPVREKFLWDEEIKIFLIKIGGEKDSNLTISKIDLSNELIGLNLPVEIKASIKNCGMEGVENCPVYLFIDGEKRGETALSILPGEKKEVGFHLTFKKGGLRKGEIRIQPDNLLPDNSFHFCFEINSPSQVLVVDDSGGEESFYLNLALKPKEGFSLIQPVLVKSEELGGVNLEGFESVFLVNIPQLGSWINRLENYILGGGGVFVFLGNQILPAWYNKINFWPAKIGKILSSPGQVRKINFKHPILKIFKEEKTFSQISFTKIRTLIPTPRSQVLVTVDQQKPLLVEKNYGQGKVMIWGSTADLTWTNFPLTPQFLPFIHQTGRYLSATRRFKDRNFWVGEKTHFLLPQNLTGSKVKITNPRGKVEEFFLRRRKNKNLLLSYPRNFYPGIYQAEFPGKQISECWAVNLLPTESNLAPAEKEEIEKIFPPGSFYLLSGKEKEKILEQIEKVQKGKEYSQGLFLLALGLFLFEGWLSNRKRKE